MSNVRLKAFSIFLERSEMLNKHRGSILLSGLGLRFKWILLNYGISILQKRKKVSEHEKVSEHVLLK